MKSNLAKAFHAKFAGWLRTSRISNRDCLQLCPPGRPTEHFEELISEMSDRRGGAGRDQQHRHMGPQRIVQVCEGDERGVRQQFARFLRVVLSGFGSRYLGCIHATTV